MFSMSHFPGNCFLSLKTNNTLFNQITFLNYHCSNLLKSNILPFHLCHLIITINHFIHFNCYKAFLVFTHHNLFNYYPVHSGYFWCFAIINNTSINVPVCVSWCTMSRKKVGLLDCGIDMYFKVDIQPKSFPPFIVFTPPQVLELKFNAEHLKLALNYQAF